MKSAVIVCNCHEIANFDEIITFQWQPSNLRGLNNKTFHCCWDWSHEQHPTVKKEKRCLLSLIFRTFYRFLYSVIVVEERKGWSAQRQPAHIRGRFDSFCVQLFWITNMKWLKRPSISFPQVRCHRHGQQTVWHAARRLHGHRPAAH